MVEQEDLVYPMIVPGAALHEMIRWPSVSNPLIETASDVYRSVSRRQSISSPTSKISLVWLHLRSVVVPLAAHQYLLGHRGGLGMPEHLAHYPGSPMRTTGCRPPRSRRRYTNRQERHPGR